MSHSSGHGKVVIYPLSHIAENQADCYMLLPQKERGQAEFNAREKGGIVKRCCKCVRSNTKSVLFACKSGILTAEEAAVPLL